ncbi:MAG: hypothetical protein HZA89_01190 [Verrucomicrobia bacterium]|nr:hypothetical protein [Verrucomicrobiota bacterium]
MERAFQILRGLRLVFAAVAVLLSGADAAFGQDTQVKVCAVCDRKLYMGRYWKHKFGVVCEECHEIKARCSLCGIPVKEGFGKTGDGRFVCKQELKDVVMTAAAAREVFNDVALELRRTARGALELKYPEVNIGFFDVDYWNSKGGQAVQADMRRIGFSLSHASGDGVAHSVVLLSGQFKSDFATVCAHEYTHLWINENKPAGRVIEPETVEAICELSAYKLMMERRDTNQLAEIRANPYTRGRILDLIEADTRLGWEAVLNWVKLGKEPKLDITAPPPRAPAPADAGSPFFTASPAVASPLPDRLTLKGILGGGKNALALINGQSFAQGDELPVKLKDKTVKVRCVEIQRSAVIVLLDGATNRVTLYLDGR